MDKITQLSTPDLLDVNGDITDPYRGFIAKSKYNRWLEDEGRRETWKETVDRYVDWIVGVQEKRGVIVRPEDVEDVRHAITYHHVMPSMRALMTAGPAAERNNISIFNCSFLAVDSVRAFDEALIILMHGTGVGFSVENKYVDKLPEVAESFHNTTTVVKVEDSKEGWAKAFKEWLALLWSGQVPTYDVSQVRPKGARLKVFGGRASGPEPLEGLFKFSRDLLINAAGRKITNLEAHDLMCKVAEIVVVGGVRRCLVATTKVQTPFGWTNISDLQVGDFIVRGGETAEVLAKVNSGVQDTLKVSFGIGNSITMTPNHRVAVFDSVDSYIFKEASELEVGDRLVWDLAGYDGEDQDLPQSEYKDHFNAKPVAIPSKVTTDIAWLIGQIHGDGYVGPKTLEISSNDNEFEYMERAQSILKSALGLDSTVARDSHGGRGIRLRANSRKLALWLSSHVKTSNSPIAIPDFIVKSSREVRAAYLAGLLDSDGRITSDGVIEQATTVYPSYAKDLQALLSGLGIFSMAYTGSAQKRRDDGVQAQDYVTVKISNLTSRLEYTSLVGPHSLTLDDVELTPSAQARDFSYPADFGVGYRNRATRRSSLIDREALNPDYQYAPVIITDIEYGGKHEVWDIEISNINEFTANGIVSHNSALISISDLGSRDMSEAKSGAWWTNNSQRALANNSAVYLKKPNMETFFREWKSLYDSKSGERGMFNLGAARKHIDPNRRDASKLMGTNPCFSGDTYLMTETGWITFKDAYLNGDPNNIVVDGRVSYKPSEDGMEHPENWKIDTRVQHRPLTIPASRVYLTQKNAQLVKVSTSNGMSVRTTPDHHFATDRGMVEASDLVPGRDKILVTRGHLPTDVLGDPNTPQELDAISMGRTHSLAEDGSLKGSEEYIHNSTTRAARFYVAAIASTKSKVTMPNTIGEDHISLTHNNRSLLELVQRICLSNGISSSLYMRLTPLDETYFQLVFMYDAFDFLTYIGVLSGVEGFDGFDGLDTETLKEVVLPGYKQGAYTTVTSVDEDGVEDVYCLKEDTRRILSANGLTARRCGEILLRDKEFCNLSEVVARAEDTPETLLEKIRIATIIGTWQASLTDFKYLRKKWKDNTEEEALLGVSITGIYGNSLLNGSQGKDVLQKFLAEGRQLAEDVNEIEARRIGVNKSAAISCVKPSGSVSQLVGTSSGIHPWYAHKYERRVRANNHDPLCQLMKDQGVPWEPEVNKPEDTAVFSFALEAPEGSIVQSDVNALDHLDLWMTYKKYWTDHNPSVTVTVEEDEWLDVGAYVYKNFDDIVGVSFLPSAGNHTYAQAPFEIVEEDRIRYLKEQVSSVDWSGLSIYEISDTTTGSQELACVAGACEVVDLDEEIEKVEVPTINLDEV